MGNDAGCIALRKKMSFEMLSFEGIGHPFLCLQLGSVLGGVPLGGPFVLWGWAIAGRGRES